MYAGRPGIPSSVATLIALGRITKRDRILDVGCGTGTDALTLARWGFGRIDAIDPDAQAIGTARSRMARIRLGGRVTFHHTGAERLTDFFEPGTFDVVLHTLVANNLREGKERHFRDLSTVMKPEGLLVLHERIARNHENTHPGRFAPLSSLRRYFDLSPGIATHLAEHRESVRAPPFARIVLWIGSPKDARHGSFAMRTSSRPLRRAERT